MSRCALPLLVALALAAAAPAAAVTTGVAFVHGTSDNDDAANDYWTYDFIGVVRDGLPDRDDYVVVNCNFNELAWKDEAAGCLATHLDDFIAERGIDDLVVITHSHGGNVMRWILSNPTWDARYPGIVEATREVIALAPSSGGTPLADAVMDGTVFEEVLGWILGYKTDAVRMQMVGNMAYLNDNEYLLGTDGHPALPVPFFAVVGTDVDSNPFDLDSWCGSYAENVGLEFTQLWLTSCSDGFLDCWSQETAGDGSIRDLDFTLGDWGDWFGATPEPLSHGQSRRDCFGLPEMLRDRL